MRFMADDVLRIKALYLFKVHINLYHGCCSQDQQSVFMYNANTQSPICSRFELESVTII